MLTITTITKKKYSTGRVSKEQLAKVLYVILKWLFVSVLKEVFFLCQPEHLGQNLICQASEVKRPQSVCHSKPIAPYKYQPEFSLFSQLCLSFCVAEKQIMKQASTLISLSFFQAENLAIIWISKNFGGGSSPSVQVKK